MSNKQVYKKHQAFNAAYEEIIKGNKNSENGFIRPQKYHHNPKKLNDFKSYIGYFHWCDELYSASSMLIILLRKIYDRAEVAPSAWFTNKNKLNETIKDYNKIKLSMNDLYDDIAEFQNCMLATDVSEKQAQINALSDQVRLLGTLENKIIETSNRKLYEISASRVTVANILIASAALLVSILSILWH